MLDAQLEHLSRVLTSKHIWALNVGENFQISICAWERFTQDLAGTAVGYMYVSEHHLKHTNSSTACATSSASIASAPPALSLSHSPASP